MHVEKLCHKWFKNTALSIDKRIQTTLFSAATTLAHSKRLSIAGLGRTLNNQTAVKHNIKRIDRLFGNKTLHEPQFGVF